MENKFKKIALVLGIGLVLFSSSISHALGLIGDNLDPTMNASQLGDQKISGTIIGIETWHKCLTIDQGQGKVTRVIVDADTRMTRDGFPIDFRDLVAGNNVTIESAAAK